MGIATFSFGPGPTGIKIDKLSQGFVVTDIEPESQADQFEDIFEGDLLVYVNDKKLTTEMTLETVNGLIKNSPRPLKLSFELGDDESTDADD